MIINERQTSEILANLPSTMLWYKCFEGTGTTLSDAAGNGGDITITNDSGVWTHTASGSGGPSSAGWASPGSNCYAQLIGDGTVDSISTPDAAGQLIIAFDIHNVAAPTTTNGYVMSYGRTTAAAPGGWAFIQLVSSGPKLRFDMTTAAGSNLVGPSTAQLSVGAGNTHTIVMDWNLSAATQQFYVDGTISNSDTEDLSASPPTADATGGLVLMARRGASSVSDHLYNAVGLPHVGNFIVVNNSTPDTGMAATLATQLANISRGQPPRVLEA